ncbi:hypothetical protein SUGI_0094960 [Cryptomeria japonica]|uniref:chloroplast sensor kinase, chloroplastic n=1 Tax=Cryptomeria japonica TaxID=3369 RepID=UPI002408C814|nr:chloroplast sensor kinase, chloroplastic [Cryptomeria japonica]GLJ08741.1 hypothetical protein SUGI_0094960 [Cryptomeria japonica]
MAQLHLSAAQQTLRHISPHMLDNHMYPKRLSNSCSLQYKETLFILGSLSKRLHRNPNAIKNGTGQSELGITENSGALHNCTGSPELGFSDNSSATKNDTGPHELGADCLEVVQCNAERGDEGELSSSAMAIALAMQKICGYSVEIVQRVEKVVPAGVFAGPSAEFRTLCIEQLSLCANIVGDDAILSIYLRPAGSYVTDQLELKQAVIYPGQELAKQDDMLLLTGIFNSQVNLRSAEAAIAEQQVEEILECNALVLPMVKDLFLVGFLVAECQMVKSGSICMPDNECELSSSDSAIKTVKIEPFQQVRDDTLSSSFSAKQKAAVTKISRSLAVAYVMDQRALLLQHTSWQKGIRMSNLMEEIYGPLSNIRTLSKMLLPHFKRTEIPHDILEDILVQGERMKDIVQELQDAFYYTKANLMHFREEDINKIERVHPHPLLRNGYVYSDYFDNDKSTKLSVGPKAGADLELPMPPLALVALPKPNMRPCNVSKLLTDLVNAGDALAHSQQQTLQLRENTHVLQAAIEESALRQALSNLLDSALLRVPAGGWVKVEAMEAPGGGVLVVIDDNGPDMSLMTQTESVVPFRSDLSSESRTEDNILWNFVAGIAIAREILERYGSVLRMLSPYLPNALLGAGGTHIEIWLPPLPVEGTTKS